jgi:hypothetical protein
MFTTISIVFGLQLKESSYYNDLRQSSYGFSDDKQYKTTSANPHSLKDTISECAPPVNSSSSILGSSGKLVNVGMVGTGLTSFSCAALKLGLRITQANMLYSFTVNASSGLILHSSQTPKAEEPVVNSEGYSLPDVDVFSDIPFMFPQMIDRLAADGYSLIATSRHRDAWLAHIMNNPKKGGCSLRVAYGLADAESHEGCVLEELTIADWGYLYDKHQEILRKRNVTQIFLEDSDGTKTRKFCSVVRVFGNSMQRRCTQLVESQAWPHVA